MNVVGKARTNAQRCTIVRTECGGCVNLATYITQEDFAAFKVDIFPNPSKPSVREVRIVQLNVIIVRGGIAHSHLSIFQTR